MRQKGYWMVFRSVKFAVLLNLLLLVNLPAQTAPSVVTMRNGIQFVGQVASVSAFSSESPNPWEAQPIAMVDDGLRRIFLNKNPNKIGNITPLNNDHPLANPTEFEIDQRVHSGRTDGFGTVNAGPFNEYGHRLIEVFDGEQRRVVAQGITRIHPHWCELKTLADSKGTKIRDWTMKVATGSIPPRILRNLLLGKIKDRDNPADYLSIVDFFRESRQYNLALDELGFIRQRFPGMKDTIDEQVEVILQLRARQWIREVNSRINAGQPQMAAKMLSVFDRVGIAGEILAEMASIQNELHNSSRRVEEIKTPIVNLVDKILENPTDAKLEDGQIPMVENFKSELNSELNPGNAPRLDAFGQFQNDTEMSPLQKLSLAISGWMLGSSNSTENFAVSQSLYPVRELVKEYLSTADKQRRQAIIKELEKYEGGEPEYLAPMIANMLPPKAPDLSAYNFNDPLQFEVMIPMPNAAENTKDEAKGNPNAGSQKQPFKYYVHLPPEYNPYRKYPCLIALPGDKNVVRELAMWCGNYNPKLGTRVGQAMREGYIVVVVDWKESAQFDYKYSAREHLTVLSAFRKAIQQFSIDTDKVFLAGHHFGADAAYDIGIAHPEHWAGVIGISGRISKYPHLYQKHKHNNLPIYSVVGEKDLDAKDKSQDAWNTWLKSKSFFDCTVVEYKGRSNELFVEEIVEIFKWMQGQNRKLPNRNGFEVKGKIRRPWDNYFWFFELHGFPKNKGVAPAFFGNRFPFPIEIEAKLRNQAQPANANRFIVRPGNQGTGITLWLSPDFVDFKKVMNVSGRGEFKKFVTPSREILLEDVRKRGDRQHPYWANIRCRGKSWEANLAEFKL